MNIQLHQVSYSYPGRGQKSFQALRPIQLSIRAGEFVALIGPSGCGKSTLLRLVAGLLQVREGKLLLDGAAPLHALARKKIGWMAQSPALMPWRTVIDNIILAQKINPQPDGQRLSAEELLEMVGLEKFRLAYPHTLSGGMQHRVALARTLALGAPLWLMDEPFASLDELTRENLSAEVLQLWARFTPTVLWITHSIYEAVQLADRVLVMSPSPGEIVADVRLELPRPRLENTRGYLAQVTRLRRYLRSNPGERGIQ
jgi:NitT/TauT family transport system ATP-binding protein